MQLDMFEKLQAKVLPFPPVRMKATIRAAAARVEAAGSRWRGVLNHEAGLLQVRFSVIGIPGDEAYRLSVVYEDAIRAEVYRLRHGGARPEPLDAA